MNLNLLGRKLWDGWMWFAHKIGWINEVIFLGIVYWVCIGAYALFYNVAKLLKPKPTTRWRPFEHQPHRLDALEKQF